jgi:hypothetical protein
MTRVDNVDRLRRELNNLRDNWRYVGCGYWREMCEFSFPQDASLETLLSHHLSQTVLNGEDFDYVLKTLSQQCNAISRRLQ